MRRLADGDSRRPPTRFTCLHTSGEVERVNERLACSLQLEKLLSYRCTERPVAMPCTCRDVAFAVWNANELDTARQ